MKQVHTLLYCIGEEAEAVLSEKSVCGKFDGFFKVRRNVIFERARFNRRNQHDGETAEQYIMELYNLSENCDYGDLKDEMIRDRLVVGIRDAVLSQQLQLDADLNLEKAKKKIRQREAVGEQQKELKGAAETLSLEEVRSRKPWKGNTKRQYAHSIRDRDGKPKTALTKKMCTRCGKGPHSWDKCPAKEATCHRCKKKGHYSSQCFTKQVSEVASESLLDTAFLDTVAAKQTSAWFATIKLNERQTNFKLDTGAEVTAISKETYRSLQNPQLTPPEKVLYGPSRQPLKALGQFWGHFPHKTNNVKQRVFVVEGLKTTPRIACYHRSGTSRSSRYDRDGCSDHYGGDQGRHPEAVSGSIPRSWEPG